MAVPAATAQIAGIRPVALTGIVTDASDAVLPGALVEVTSGGREVAMATTDGAGRYRVELAPNALFRVRIALDGFEQQTLEVQTSAADLSRDFMLQIGGLNEAIVVTGVVSQHLQRGRQRAAGLICRRYRRRPASRSLLANRCRSLRTRRLPPSPLGQRASSTRRPRLALL
ncbi:MAG: hypothetical protein GEU82_05195 [Luteitalea sp.]|nr:hypothetical protein [Luteitalea sp.]